MSTRALITWLSLGRQHSSRADFSVSADAEAPFLQPTARPVVLRPRFSLLDNLVLVVMAFDLAIPTNARRSRIAGNFD
jgi:hypothetical protein